MSGKASTRDLGIAIRDFLEGMPFEIFAEGSDHPAKNVNGSIVTRAVEFIDVSDPNNPVVQLDNGQLFEIRIFAKG